MDKTKELDNSKDIDNIKNYINQLNDVEKLIFKTAENQLDSSFDIFKSIGFLEWSTNKD
tara:strand:- start:84 stop:260 length:177 start_codon:yes stop_codon:yes gene_type:complete